MEKVRLGLMVREATVRCNRERFNNQDAIKHVVLNNLLYEFPHRLVSEGDSESIRFSVNLALYTTLNCEDSHRDSNQGAYGDRQLPNTT